MNGKPTTFSATLSLNRASLVLVQFCGPPICVTPLPISTLLDAAITVPYPMAVAFVSAGVVLLLVA